MKDGLLDRVAQLEAERTEIIKFVQAVARVVGPDEVQAELAAGQRAEMEQTLAEAVKKGQWSKSDVVDEASLIVGSEQQKEGGLVFPGRFQITFGALSEDGKGLMLGKKAGDKVTLPSGNVVTVLEVYRSSAAKPPKKSKARKKAAKPAINSAVPYDPAN